MLEQAQIAAEQEVKAALSFTTHKINQELKAIADWDEVHQQFHDSSYYFYWHDERLKESGYFKPHYDQLELYTAERRLLTPASPNSQSHLTLPLHIKDTTPTVVFKPNAETHLNVFEPIYERSTQKILGYVGISIDLLPTLLSDNTFYFTNKSSLHFNGDGQVPLSTILQYTQFFPVSNPVSDHLWQLIETFLTESALLLLIAATMFLFIFNHMINKPLQVLSAYLQRLKTHPSETHTAPTNTFLLQEFEDLKHSLHTYHRDLQHTQHALDQQNLLVWDQARRDALTNIYNRRAFDEAWHDILTHYASHPVNIAFILFDCDFFKALNDTYGHEIGDEVICITASTIQQSLPIDCSVYRIGGDEFAVITQDKSADETLAIATQCLNALNEANFYSIGIKEKLSYSIGISTVNSSDGAVDQHVLSSLPRQADIAMYKAKQSQQHKIQFYHHTLDQEAHGMVSNVVVNAVVDAIHTGHNIVMHYQPICSVMDGKIYYESLIRIRQPNSDVLIYPNDIFAVVTRRRLEVEIDTQVIHQILQALQSGVISQNTGVSVNISGKTLLQPFFIDLFKPFIPFLALHKIVIEITENILIDHMEYAQEVLSTLRSQGFLIALDDFGSGYSSIRYLANMPVDIIKFDISMTRALSGDDKTRNIIASTADMVRRSDYELVMEGIEDYAMLELAKKAGATHVQGYLLGKPDQTLSPPLISIAQIIEPFKHSKPAKPTNLDAAIAPN
ncbi:bifunctional diguanylate cyclase/phosphodiesterase [Thiomicrorhabdus aquaedulcis]|uniref:bifunctional diguanylate cyclase/phosphodiesterase n=1 Tax=Thiomicrorhabdus aquaedulcis TaxID=2211106 RepID=UPI000FDAA3DA|nr:bifunctional diguanylate cyclase/phosphodiesterase [Thiomicrorhabdus aquaedulcis]